MGGGRQGFGGERVEGDEVRTATALSTALAGGYFTHTHTHTHTHTDARTHERTRTHKYATSI